ncbi:MAG: hypothetical protein ACYSW3_18395 [Planctomycetota bacterium]|jgi:triosephosphate isomerase
MRKPFVAGNWKMNTDSQSSVNLAESIASGASEIADQSVSRRSSRLLFTCHP